MSDERHGPSDGGNGGPVVPGGDPLGPAGREPGNGAGNGNGAGRGPGLGGHHPGTVAVPDADPGVGAAPDTEFPDREDETGPERDLRRTRTSGVWVGVTLSALVLIFLLIFIVQNNTPTEIHFLGAEGTLPVGVALLFAAALGVLLVAIPGYLRILQLRRAARRHRVR